ncbi:MAG: hypothetical protein KIS73_29005 [Enhydrobacter sp.]|nr:hypothetical protein [Enhydrobacter sp.]
MKKVALIVALATSACSAPQAIQLRDPQTRHVVECKADPWAVYSWDTKRWNEECAARYERNGFQRIQ